MTTIGRRPNKRVGIPNNRLMNQRANAHLENYAKSRAEAFNTALAVDGPRFYFWTKSRGSIPCSCSAADTGPFATIPNSDSDIVEDLDSVVGAGIDSGDADFEDLTYTQYQNVNVDRHSINDIFDKKISPNKPSAVDQMADEGDDDTINEVEDIGTGQTDFQDPFNLFSDKTINCPICFGSGYLDAWQLHGGQRFVFETSNFYGFSSQGVDIDDSANPTQMFAHEDGKAFWTVKLPYVWNHILRVDVFNGNDRVSSDDYTWTWYDKNDTSISGEVSELGLNALQEVGKQVRLVLDFHVENDFTHAEIIFAYREPYYAQIPEIQQGYELEFLDWNVNLSVELPPDLDIKEGDYLTEAKYAKVWKVSTLTKKKTAGGTTFGLSADLRALHSFEKMFAQLSLFGSPKNVYDTPLLQYRPE